MIVGVVGKANVGKSTFFKAATLAEVEIANYPFATIKPNHGVGFVKVECPEKFFKVKCNPRFGYCMDGIRFVPIDMIDVAGLVPGAHEGKGMGNQFLSDLNQADALIHVVDISGSTNEKGEPIDPGSYDPAYDIRFLEEELDYWYLGILKKGWEKFARSVQQTHGDIVKSIAKQLSGLNVDEDMAKEVLEQLNLTAGNITEWSSENLFDLAKEFRKRTKPMIIAANKIDVHGAKDNFERIRKDFPDYVIIPCSAESELALREAAHHELIRYIPGEDDFEIIKQDKLNEKQLKALGFIKTNILGIFKSTGVQQVIDYSIFKTLEYMPIFPGGVHKLEDSDGRVLPDCFLLPKNSTALDFAFRVHTDFGKNFIRAIDVKKRLTVGKNHVLKPGDVVEIVANK
ncbi:MAG: redox-regulated ATPase YchF [Candidatus Woesearchaeota archaeon]